MAKFGQLWRFHSSVKPRDIFLLSNLLKDGGRPQLRKLHTPRIRMFKLSLLVALVVALVATAQPGPGQLCP
jgi:hypothetical protein